MLAKKEQDPNAPFQSIQPQAEPSARETPLTQAGRAPAGLENVKEGAYTVQAGESTWKILQTQYGMTDTQIANLLSGRGVEGMEVTMDMASLSTTLSVALLHPALG